MNIKQGVAMLVVFTMLATAFVCASVCMNDAFYDGECEHDVVVDPAVSETCISYGLTEGSHCSKCGLVFKEQEIIPATGHKLCQSTDIHDIEYGDGYSVKRCDVCGEYVSNPAFPVMVINTEGSEPIVSKETYLKCGVSVSNTDEGFEFEDKSASIKGRGNSTWSLTFPKLPYQLKFDEKVDLFGNGAAKKWILLANYYDMSSLHTILAFNAGKEIGLTSTPSVNYVNLYVNSKFCGVYTVVEKIEIGKNRVDISKDSGYIVEIDLFARREGTEGKDYFVIDDQPYAFKDPDPEDIGPSDFNAVKTAFTDAYNSLDSGDFSEVKSHLDVDSFARTYLINELFSNQDNGITSTYMYMELGGVIHSGPVWDFDRSTGAESPSMALPNKLNVIDRNTWYSKLFQYDEFRALVSEIFTEKYAAISNTIYDTIDYALKYRDNIEFDVNINFAPDDYQWVGCMVSYDGIKYVTLKSWQEEIDFLYYWLGVRLDFMKSCFYNG